jgi:hypothetical protein
MRRFKSKDIAMGQSFRLVRKSPLFKQDSNFRSQDKLEVIKQLRGSHPFPGTEDLLNLFIDDLEFIGSCLSTCMQTNQVF